MITIKSIFERLKPADQQLLTYSLENGIGQFVKLEGGKYIGVNVSNTIKNLYPEIVVGNWSYGSIKT